jgi:poly(A) polymerase
MILNLVPEVNTFRTAAHNQAVGQTYVNHHLHGLTPQGGVSMPTSWATLVVLPGRSSLPVSASCTPTLAPSTIVAKFFPSTTSGESPLPVMALTDQGWPQPVLLKRIDPGPPNMTHQVWNPRVS